MAGRIRNFLILGVIIASIYFLSSHHVVFLDTDYELLKKSELTLEYTFVNLNNRDPADVMANDVLRDAGIGEILVDMGLLSETRAAELEFWYDNQ